MLSAIQATAGAYPAYDHVFIRSGDMLSPVPDLSPQSSGSVPNVVHVRAFIWLIMVIPRPKDVKKRGDEANSENGLPSK